MMHQCSTCPHCGAPIYARMLPNEGTADLTPETIFSCQCRLTMAPRMAPLLIPIWQPGLPEPVQPWRWDPGPGAIITITERTVCDATNLAGEAWRPNLNTEVIN